MASASDRSTDESERRRVAALSSWYADGQLAIDQRVLEFRYATAKPHFRGPAILELGCGGGEMTALLLADAEVLTVVDGAQALLDRIPDHDRLEKVCELFEDFVPTRTYGTIVMDHVLEHLADPVDVLRRARTWLAPGGVLVAGVPNALSLHRLAAVEMGLLDDCHELNNRDHAVGHRRVYDFELLCEHVTEAGFEVVERQGVFLKPLSNAQIEEQWGDDVIAAFLALGTKLPDHAAELSLIVRPRS